MNATISFFCQNVRRHSDKFRFHTRHGLWMWLAVSSSYAQLATDLYSWDNTCHILAVTNQLTMSTVAVLLLLFLLASCFCLSIPTIYSYYYCKCDLKGRRWMTAFVTKHPSILAPLLLRLLSRHVTSRVLVRVLLCLPAHMYLPRSIGS